MNQDVKKEWLEALRSKEYQQTRGYLKTDKGFCCLGVLTDIYIKQHNDIWRHNHGCDYYKDEDRFLPEEVAKWAGLDEPDPKVDTEDNDDQALSELNDDGYDFESIADLIEEQL